MPRACTHTRAGRNAVALAALAAGTAALTGVAQAVTIDQYATGGSVAAPFVSPRVVGLSQTRVVDRSHGHDV